jgi:arsenical resistance protein ArsH
MNTVIFACVHNAGRSQMAAAFFNALVDPTVAHAVSAGTEPGDRVHAEVIVAMREEGIDLADARPQRLTDALARDAQLLITMGCGDACPVVPGLARDDWPLEDPKNKPIERVRAIRDDVRARVETLLRAKGWRRDVDARDAIDLPNVDLAHLDVPDLGKLAPRRVSTHRPRILLLYGSCRERSYSRLLTEEAARILERFGAETRIYDPRGLPLPDSEPATHPKVVELRELSLWSEGQVWCSPERHGAMTGVFKSQIDWLPLELGSLRPTQGRTLAVMQVSGGSQSFNAVNALRVLGRWMRMFTIPNQSSVAKAFQEFDEAGRMKPSAYYERVVDVMEELFKFTLLLRDRTDYFVSRYSERKEAGAKSEAARLAALAMEHERDAKASTTAR